MPDTGADLTGFLQAAGRSLADAQGALAGEVADVPTAVAISDAELEVKATIQRSAAGAVALQPISSGDVVKGGIEAGLLSTVRVRYVAVTEDVGALAPVRPVQTAERVIDAVKGRSDVAALDKILGGLKYEALFVPERQRWLVTAKDPQDRLVREVVVADATAKGSVDS
jgi:hypothetical protein